MSTKWISEEAQRFVSENIRSVGQLEALLLVAGQPQKKWTAASIGEELRTGGDGVERWLKELCDAKVLSCENASPPVFQLAAGDSGKVQVLQELKIAYQSYRMRVIDLIYASDGASVRSLADAFRWRK